MAIQLINLSPTKNSSGISINEDISLTLTSDSAELDISSLSFLINGIDVQLSAYYGANNNEINASFSARKRIKYNLRTYGQTKFRYVEIDDAPIPGEYGHK